MLPSFTPRLKQLTPNRFKAARNFQSSNLVEFYRWLYRALNVLLKGKLIHSAVEGFLKRTRIIIQGTSNIEGGE